MKTAIFLNIFIICSGLICSARGIEESLRDFHKHPYQAMDRLAPEVVDGKVISRGSINYKKVAHQLVEKNLIREKIIRSSNQIFDPFSKVADNDQAVTLVENQNVVSQITDLDSRGLMRSSLSILPWADSYWPIYKGLLGHRYADPKFPDSKVWLENYNYILSHPASWVVANGNQKEINNLSPAEKYDFLVGDPNMTLTYFSWAQGQKYMNREGHVQTWMGICHGWAGAAHMTEPVLYSSIRLRAANGMPIVFYQSDVKALQSMLWANSSPATRFSGTGCKVSRPARDRYGRVTDPGCLDNNPATFFLVLTNQLGIHQRSFIMDATYDAEVWNYPIASYKMMYFNPQSLHPTNELRLAMIPLERFAIDKFRSYRAPEARYVVGVVSDVTFVIEIEPSHRSSNKPPTKTLRFLYDLELDSNYNIVGGEWYMNAHPDFLWTYAKGAQAKARGESVLRNERWSIGGPVPSSWRSLAQQASSVGSPLYSIVKEMIEAVPAPEDPIDSTLAN